MGGWLIIIVITTNMQLHASEENIILMKEHCKEKVEMLCYIYILKHRWLFFKLTLKELR